MTKINLCEVLGCYSNKDYGSRFCKEHELNKEVQKLMNNIDELKFLLKKDNNTSFWQGYMSGVIVTIICLIIVSII